MIKVFAKGDMPYDVNFEDEVNKFIKSLGKVPHQLYVTATGKSSRFLTIVVEYG